jgi:hypothetical protein
MPYSLTRSKQIFSHLETFTHSYSEKWSTPRSFNNQNRSLSISFAPLSLVRSILFIIDLKTLTLAMPHSFTRARRVSSGFNNSQDSESPVLRPHTVDKLHVLPNSPQGGGAEFTSHTADTSFSHGTTCSHRISQNSYQPLTSSSLINQPCVSEESKIDACLLLPSRAASHLSDSPRNLPPIQTLVCSTNCLKYGLSANYTDPETIRLHLAMRK